MHANAIRTLCQDSPIFSILNPPSIKSREITVAQYLLHSCLVWTVVNAQWINHSIPSGQRTAKYKLAGHQHAFLWWCMGWWGRGKTLSFPLILSHFLISLQFSLLYGSVFQFKRRVGVQGGVCVSVSRLCVCVHAYVRKDGAEKRQTLKSVMRFKVYLIMEAEKYLKI